MWLYLYNFSKFLKNKNKFIYIKLVDDLTISKIYYEIQINILFIFCIA